MTLVITSLKAHALYTPRVLDGIWVGGASCLRVVQDALLSRNVTYFYRL